MLDYEGNSNIMCKFRAPLFKTPVTDFFSQIRNLQFHKECAPYELMFIDCMEAYGYHLGIPKCRMILNDMYECVYKIKRMRRIVAMYDERKRQYQNGERKEYYPPGPPLDVY